jgi:hypothetical protein
MPRESAASRAAAKWRFGGEPPKPPRGMSPAARELWKDIAGARPPAFFQPGATCLLRTFCEITVALEQMTPKLAGSMDETLLKRVQVLTNLQALLAQKCRISVQSAIKWDRALVMERSEPPKSEHAHLLGGRAAWRSRQHYGKPDDD